MKRAWVAILLLSCCAGARAQNGAVHLLGYAYDLESNRFLYSELHEARITGGEWLGGSTAYFLPDGKEFGRKTLDFTGDLFVPRYRFEEQDGYREEITDNGGTIAMLRQQPGGTPRTASVAKAGMVAADSGVPRLLRARFDALTRGETLAFRVVAPSRLETYKFKARRIADEPFEGQPAAAIQVDMDSFLKLFAGSLIFLYDPASRRLLEFRGTTNVRDPATGEAFNVRISYYSKPPKEATGVPPLPAAVPLR